MDNGENSYRRFLSGDDKGIAELLSDYGDPLMLYLNNYVDDINIAEDLMQETFIKLAVKKPKYKSGKSSFKTWFYAIGRNIAIDYIRKKSNKKQASIDDYSELKSESDIEEEYLISERNLDLYRALKNLKTEYRQALYLTYFENFSNDETAIIMRKSSKQIRNLLYNARKSLKAELERGEFFNEEL